MFKMYTNTKRGSWKCNVSTDEELRCWKEMSTWNKGERLRNALISHQTGTTMRTLFPHMTASTPYITLVIKSQNAMESVATFPARQCQGMTKRTEHAAMNAIGGNSGCMTGKCLVLMEKIKRIQRGRQIFEPSS